MAHDEKTDNSSAATDAAIKKSAKIVEDHSKSISESAEELKSFRRGN